MNWLVAWRWCVGICAGILVICLSWTMATDKKNRRALWYMLGAIVLVALVAGLVSGLNLRVVAG